MADQYACRVFDLEDQEAFAAVSGDRNPIHLDAVEARRLITGKVAVHGIHIVLVALDHLVAKHAGIRSLARLWVQFERPLGVDEEARFLWNAQDGRFVGRVEGPAGTLVRLHLDPGAERGPAWAGDQRAPTPDCAEHRLNDLNGFAGEVPLTLPSGSAHLFPHLTDAFSQEQIAILLATTRLVGMLCPGRDSLYAGLRLDFADPGGAVDTLDYHVIRADARTGLVELAIAAGANTGTISALNRPKPVQQPSLAALRPLVGADEFVGQRAIVIGGSRGLGELTAKLLAAGGADVTVTYFQGEADARRLTGEAEAEGLAIASQRFDIAAPPREPQNTVSYTHAYYFATPRIERGDPAQFNAARFARYVEYYVTGLAATVQWLRSNASEGACLWYPSSVFVTEHNPTFAEYAAAKAAGEALCVALRAAAAPMCFEYKRLPPLASDQTQSVAAAPVPDGTVTMLAELRRLASSEASAARHA